MAFPILGSPKLQFFDDNGDPLVSGTITITDPDTSSAKTYYTSRVFADAGTNGATAP